MSAYTIDYTDPLLNEFIIQPGGFDGPGGSSTHSTLRLYGRGTLEWGESVDEDLLRLAESFAGSTAPHNPIGGQLWFQTIFYRHITASGLGAGWYVYNPNTKVWGVITVTVVIALTTVGATIGDYCYLNAGSSADGLYRYDSAYKQESATWLSRLFTQTTIIPVTEVPVQNLKVYDAYGNSSAGQWVSPMSTAVEASPGPISPQQGAMWFDTTTGRLSVWTGTVWQHLLGPSSGTATVASAGIYANGFAITNLNTTVPLVQGSGTVPHPVTTNNNAADKTYVDAQDDNWGTFTSTHYVPIVGTGAIPITGDIVSLADIELHHLTVNGTLTLTGSANINANNRPIVNVALVPFDGTSAVNANYVNAQIAAVAPTYVNVTGDTMSGTLFLSGTIAAQLSGALSTFDVNNKRIVNVTDSPTALTDAVNANYVNTQISTAIAVATGSTIPVIYTALGAAKNGDIGIIGSTIWMYAGGWKKIFPAVYS